MNGPSSIARTLSRRILLLCAATLALGTTAVIAQTADAPTQRIIVKWKPRQALTQLGTSPAQALADASARLGISLTSTRTIATGAEVLRLDRRLSGGEMADLIASMASNASVEYVEEDKLMKPLFTPNDTRYSEQWQYFEAAGGINAPAAWDVANGTGVTVAVVDTGYRPHADLAANIVGGYDFISDTFIANDGNGRDSNSQDPGDFTAANACAAGEPASNSSWHGTHVAGTIAAVSNNGSGVAGVAFGARVVPVRVLGRCGGLTSDIADAIVWASGGTVGGLPANANPAKLINMSLGGSGACGTTFQNAINSARSRGTAVLVAAGNSNTNASNASPANCVGVIAVASVNRSGGRAFYSNFGAVVDIAAPGGDTRTSAANGILSTLNAGATTPAADSFAFYQGTSMATPHVVGVAALMLSVNGGLTPDQVESVLKSTARGFPATCSQCGAGIVNAAAAVAAADGGGGGGNQLQNNVPVSGLAGPTGTELRFTLVVPSGATNLRFQISGGTGDADLYTRFGSPPTTGTFDCRPYFNGNAETCTVAAPPAGTYHVMVRAYTTFSGVTLRGSFTP